MSNHPPFRDPAHPSDGRPVPLDDLLRGRSRHQGFEGHQIVGLLLLLLVLLTVCTFFGARLWMRHAVNASLPQIDGSLSIPDLSAPVTVARDHHGVPHLRASTVDDLLVAQGFVTAQDRLWQMETLRRHAAGTLAEILGPKLLGHDQTQRVLQLRAAADRAIAVLPQDQLHQLEFYARGVNASMAIQQAHLPVEFRVLRFAPAPWTPRDSLLVSLAMFEDLTNTYPEKLARETIAARLPPDLLADLYPVGSWRDHPVVDPTPDLTQEPPDTPEIPLDESQTLLDTPEHIQGLLAAQPSRACESCLPGSNNWVVAGSRTATGKPLLSNDMHLSHGVPGIWYEADLAVSSASGSAFHAAGVTLPGTPFVIVGHNDHVAWGFTNLGADVQDLTVEHTRGSGLAAQFQAADGSWHRLLFRAETIHVHGGKDIVLEVPIVGHGNMITPLITPLYPGEKRPISLSWTVYDPANVTSPFFGVNSAPDGLSLAAAFSTFGGPAQNMVYADDQGHIGYHAVGHIPVRGDAAHPSALQPIPAAPSPANEWAGYIPYGELPQAYDPASGLLATANARVVPEAFRFPITLNWAAPYRNERIWKVLSTRTGLTAADLLHLQTDIYSDLDHAIAQRLAYALDHATISAGKQKRLHQAADLLRDWDGEVDANASAPALVDAARSTLWDLILRPKLGEAARLYAWDEKPYVEEQLILHTPARWLPAAYKNWDDLLAAAVDQALDASKAPSDLQTWHYGALHPVDIEHPVFSSSPFLKYLLGLPVGTGPVPQSGDGSTIKQVGRTFGPSERFTADLRDLDHSTLNLVLGQSGNPASPWFMDQWQAWYAGTTFPLPYRDTAVQAATTHTLTLKPKT